MHILRQCDMYLAFGSVLYETLGKDFVKSPQIGTFCQYAHSPSKLPPLIRFHP